MDYKELWTDPGFMEMVIDYVKSLFKRFNDWSFEDAMSDPARLAGEAHKIAGSAGMYGFDDLSHTARSLEEAIRGNSTDNVILSLFQELKTQILLARDEAFADVAENG